MITNAIQLIDKVNDALTSIRPFLIADGGDIELIEITDNNVARVKLLGACGSCNMSAMTMKAGVEEAIMRMAPEITAVEAVAIEI
jgi:Fe-S cluster biogenesis protein NfuA